MKLKLVSLLLVMCVGSTLCAQDNIFDKLGRKSPGEGTIVVYQDSRLADLVGKTRGSGSDNGTAKVQKVSGYRVQVYAGHNSQVARSEAQKMTNKVKELFPSYQVYMLFAAPRWLCQVGDYRTIEEADAIMRQMKATGAFKELSIVRTLVNL